MLTSKDFKFLTTEESNKLRSSLAKKCIIQIKKELTEEDIISISEILKKSEANEKKIICSVLLKMYINEPIFYLRVNREINDLIIEKPLKK